MSHTDELHHTYILHYTHITPTPHYTAPHLHTPHSVNGAMMVPKQKSNYLNPLAYAEDSDGGVWMCRVCVLL
jgi:hypothetical protein